jgi:tricorn protease
MDGRRLTEIADDPRGQIFDYTWSPARQPPGLQHGRPAAPAPSTSGARATAASAGHGGLLQRVQPRLGRATANYLYYLSNREFAPQLSNNEWNFAGNRSTRIYALSLRATCRTRSRRGATRSPSTRASGPAPAPPAPGDAAGRRARCASTSTASRRRVAPVPLQADNYGGLSRTRATSSTACAAPATTAAAASAAALKVFSLATAPRRRSPRTSPATRSPQDGKKLLVREGGNFVLYDARTGGGSAKKTVSTANMYVDRVPAQEWAQIFDEVWRRYRDFFYVENMHGYDWEALREQYRPLLAHVAHRSDLNYLISEMIAELSVQHAYIAGGDWDPPPARVALPGARFELDPRTGRYRISQDLPRPQRGGPIYRSPLTEVGVDAAVGDYVLAIDGVRSCRRGPVPPAAPQGRPPGDAHPQPRAGHARRPGGDVQARHERVGPGLPGLGRGQPRASTR